MDNQFLYISSVHNPLVKGTVLLKQAKYRKKAGRFLAEGLRTLETIFQSNLSLVNLFATELHLRQALALTNEHQKIVLCSDHVIEKISSSITPVGLVGVFAQPAPTIADFKAPGIVLAQIADPGNMGTLIRSAAAFNAKTVVLVEGVDPWSAKVIQSSVGTVGMVTVIECSWHELVKVCQERAVLLNALVVDGADILFSQPQQLSQLLVVGNEAHGLPKEWQKDCQLKTTIAMPGKVESLNVAVAGSIALYEITKQR